MKKYDFLIVGAGLAGATFAYEAGLRGKRCLVVDRRSVVGGNLRCSDVNGIYVSDYGPHIFHTDNYRVWKYVNRFVQFVPYTHQPIAVTRRGVFNLPFNMNTFSRLWGCVTPQDAIKRIEAETAPYRLIEPTNLEEQALKLVGSELYELLVKEYTEKQWGRACTELPPFIIKRLPIRFTYDNNYFADAFQGVPLCGNYNHMVDKMLERADVQLSDQIPFEDFSRYAETVVYTGCIDELFDYCYGRLDYRSLRFENKTYDASNHQGVAVCNYTTATVGYTRSTEYRHFPTNSPFTATTVVQYEYPCQYDETAEPLYPINNERNSSMLEKYKLLARRQRNIVLLGRLAEYKYYDMDDIIKCVLDLWTKR